MQGKGRAFIADFVSAFGGSHRHVIDYLAEEVIAQQPDEIHDFLCQTSILDRLTAPLCDAVTGGNNSAAILRQLEQDNLFLIQLDDGRQWYRYHRLFADFLHSHLHQDMADCVPELHQRASGPLGPPTGALPGFSFGKVSPLVCLAGCSAWGWLFPWAGDLAMPWDFPSWESPSPLPIRSPASGSGWDWS